MRLDEEKLDALRRWAERLREEGSEEHAAAGRAILMLLEEIDELREGLSELRLQTIPAASDPSPEVPEAPDPEEPAATLQNRLRRVLRRDSSAPADAPAPDGATDSAQSWIESLRRQK